MHRRSSKVVDPASVGVQRRRKCVHLLGWQEVIALKDLLGRGIAPLAASIASLISVGLLLLVLVRLLVQSHPGGKWVLVKAASCDGRRAQHARRRRHIVAICIGHLGLLLGASVGAITPVESVTARTLEDIARARRSNSSVLTFFAELACTVHLLLALGCVLGGIRAALVCKSTC
jgi:hypothetical protein